MHYQLQQIQFPVPGICDKQEMFFRPDSGCPVHMTEKCCIIPFGKEISFDTYFNSFSAAKWKKYTKLENLSLAIDFSGELLVRICTARIIDGAVFTKVIKETHLAGEERRVSSVTLSPEPDDLILYFTVTAESETAFFYGGAYYTDVSPEMTKKVRIGIDICTYRKEKFVLNNIQILKEMIIDNENSPMHGSLDVFISDNSQTLPESAASEHIHIFKNRNLGGAGGFGRAMVEILKEKDRLGLTHILMMDDDVVLSPCALEKTAAFLGLLKQEYSNAFIGGHMLKLNDSCIQSEAADYFHNVSHTPVNSRFDLSDPQWVLRNEREEPINHFGWWYCCMPITVVREDNLPLPIFIKRDDIEYGLRNGETFITLNGINVWHEEFNYKHSSYLEYYYYRNLCILTSIHRYSVSAKEIWAHVKSGIETKLFTYRYKEAELILMGINDFLKGIDWLKKQDGEALNQKIMALGYKKSSVESLDWEFTYGSFLNNSKNVPYAGRKQELIKKITRNGLLLPAHKKIVIKAYKPDPGRFYRVYQALNYEDITGTGFITQKSIRSYLAVKKMQRQTEKQFLKNYKNVSLEYRTRYRELAALEFWQKYLFQSGETSEYISQLPVIRPKSYRGEILQLVKDNVKRIFQKAFSWRPLDTKLILVSVARRNGFTCSPKYIVQALREQYGDRLNICWLSDRPQSCGEIRKLGIPVIDIYSRSHFLKSMQAKVYITNDAFPAWLNHRKGQIWINTWHAAVNYKHIGYDYVLAKSWAEAQTYKMQNRQPDYYIAGSEQFLEDTSKSFRLDPSVFIKTGLPRNDIFFRDNSELKRKIAEHFGISEDDKIILYAPTFRKMISSSTHGLDFSQLKLAAEKICHGNCVIFIRNHSFVPNDRFSAENAVNVTNYADMNELLAVSDILISDYSSCMYDFALQMKPCFVYAPDFAKYGKEDRGFAIPPEKWPYPIATSNEELIKNIEQFDEQDYRERLESHFRDVVRYDKGTASEEIAKLIGRHCGLE